MSFLPKNLVCFKKKKIIFSKIFYRRLRWLKRLDSRLLTMGTRVRVSVTPCGFRSWRNGVWVGFFGVYLVFPCHKYRSIISPHSSHSFRFIPFHPPLWWCFRRHPRPCPVSDRIWGCMYIYDLHLWPSSDGQWTSALLSEPFFVTHATIFSPDCTFQTPARFFLNAFGSFLFECPLYLRGLGFDVGTI